FLTDICLDCYQEALENMRIEYDAIFPDVCTFAEDIDSLLNHNFWQKKNILTPNPSGELPSLDYH
ncbi:MAG: hypothetical protein ACKO7A_16385, partial [Microcystis sp.]